ncbi:MAG: Nif11 domain/cupin domain-containing protein [Cyanobacteriota bacterium]
MADADFERFLDKIQQLNAFVALSERNPELRQALRQCDHHDEVVALAQTHGFEIGRRWGEPPQSGESLLDGPVPAVGEERVTVLLRTANLRLERIHSCAASSPPDFWYEQEEAEWVCLLRGRATERVADEPSPRQLGPGDSLMIKPLHRHRLVATDPPPGTIWLALFWLEPPLG